MHNQTKILEIDARLPECSEWTLYKTYLQNFDFIVRNGSIFWCDRSCSPYLCELV
jgi:hypothetical protein